MGQLTIKGTISNKRANEKYLSVEIPELDVYTQGEDVDDCVEMAIDAIKNLFEDDFDIQFLSFDENDKNTFYLKSNDPGPLYSRILQTLRINSGLSIREVSNLLGDSSHNNYAQYEQGKSIPSITKFNDIVEAITGGQRTVVLSFPKIKKAG